MQSPLNVWTIFFDAWWLLRSAKGFSASITRYLIWNGKLSTVGSKSCCIYTALKHISCKRSAFQWNRLATIPITGNVILFHDFIAYFIRRSIAVAIDNKLNSSHFAFLLQFHSAEPFFFQQVYFLHRILATIHKTFN